MIRKSIYFAFAILVIVVLFRIVLFIEFLSDMYQILGALKGGYMETVVHFTGGQLLLGGLLLFIIGVVVGVVFTASAALSTKANEEDNIKVWWLKHLYGKKKDGE